MATYTNSIWGDNKNFSYMEKKYNWKMIGKTSLVSKSLATPAYKEPNCIQLSQSN